MTPIIFWKGCDAIRFLQNKETNEITALSEELYRMIDCSNMESEESRPAGPSSDVHGERYYWLNEFCALELRGTYLRDPKIIHAAALLSEIDFKEGK